MATYYTSSFENPGGLWQPWRRKERRMKNALRNGSVSNWLTRDYMLAYQPRPGIPFAKADTIIGAGDKDGTWKTFPDTPASGNNLLWPVPVWIPPWAVTLRVFFFTMSAMSGGGYYSIQGRLGSGDGSSLFYDDVSTTESRYVDVPVGTDEEGSVQNFDMRWSAEAGSGLIGLEVNNCGDLGSTSLHYFRDCIWIPGSGV